MLRRILASIAVALALVGPAHADSTVGALPAATSLLGPELFYCVQGGADHKCTATQIQTFSGTIVQTGNGATGGTCNPGATPCTISTQEQINSLTGTNPAILTAAWGQFSNLANASAQTPTIQEAGLTGFPAGSFFDIANTGAGVQTLTSLNGASPSGTIGGAATLVFPAGSATAPRFARIASDGISNYQIVWSTLTFTTGPSSAVSGNLPSFNGTTGLSLQDSGVSSTNLALLTGNQTIAGVKTFSSAPIFSSITGSTQCLQVNTTGQVAGSGGACGGSSTITAGTTATSGFSAGQVLYSDGSLVQAAGVTGSLGNVVLSVSPSLTTPTLGVASATSINKVALTTPATAATLTIANNKTLTVSNSLTFTGTDSTSFAFPGTSDTVATLGAANAFTGNESHSGTELFTGTTVPTFSGTGQTFITGSLGSAPTTGSNGDVWIGSFSTTGATIQGKGSSKDFQLENSAGTAVMTVNTASTTVNFTGIVNTGTLISLGPNVTTGTGINSTITTGTATTGVTGSILLTTGSASGAGTVGSITLGLGTTSGGTAGNLILTNMPTSGSSISGGSYVCVNSSNQVVLDSVICVSVSTMDAKNLVEVLNESARGDDYLHEPIPIAFTFKDQKRWDDKTHIGLAAQAVCSIDERMCIRDKDTGKIESYDRDGMIAYLSGEVEDLKRQVH